MEQKQAYILITLRWRSKRKEKAHNHTLTVNAYVQPVHFSSLSTVRVYILCNFMIFFLLSFPTNTHTHSINASILAIPFLIQICGKRIPLGIVLLFSTVLVTTPRWRRLVADDKHILSITDFAPFAVCLKWSSMPPQVVHFVFFFYFKHTLRYLPMIKPIAMLSLGSESMIRLSISLRFAVHSTWIATKYESILIKSHAQRANVNKAQFRPNPTGY